MRTDVKDRGASCHSGGILGQLLAIAGRFEEAWQAFEDHFSAPAPFDAFALKRGRMIPNLALVDITKGTETGLRFSGIEARVREWNLQATQVGGRPLKSLPTLLAALTDPWFHALPRFSQLRVLAYFRFVRPDEAAEEYFRRNGALPNEGLFEDTKKFEAALDSSPVARSLWDEITQVDEIGSLF